MLRLLRAATRLEAYLLRDLLGINGIRAHVFNEHASSIVGEVPPDVSMPEVWLDDDADLDRARRVLDEHAAGAGGKAPSYCRKCGEENPPAFEMCWHCGTFIWNC